MTQRPFTFITQTSVTSKAPAETVYDTIADLQAHLEWSGERASDENFRLLTLEADEGSVGVGTGSHPRAPTSTAPTIIHRSWRRRGPADSSSRRTRGSIASAGDRGKCKLKSRVERREELDIRPLAPVSAERYTTEWRDVQARFVDSPEGALRDADQLVTTVMRERGYPMDDFDQRSSDISVDHADVVEDYRAGHAISLANDHGQASTEDLRQAMVHYRSLFERMVEVEGQQTSRGVQR